MLDLIWKDFVAARRFLSGEKDGFDTQFFTLYQTLMLLPPPRYLDPGE